VLPAAEPHCQTQRKSLLSKDEARRIAANIAKLSDWRKD
jgi:hypothetical protein